MNRRKSTVHDLAALRLHPDGSRVPSASLNTKSKPKGRIAVDRKNNWIAYDAGGSASVKTKRRKKTKAEDGKSASKAQKKAPNIPAELSPDESDHQSAWSPSDDDISGDEAQGNMNTKSKKRKRFNHTFDFLSNPKLSNGKNMEFPPIYADDFRSVPLPSSVWHIFEAFVPTRNANLLRFSHHRIYLNLFITTLVHFTQTKAHCLTPLPKLGENG